MYSLVIIRQTGRDLQSSIRALSEMKEMAALLMDMIFPSRPKNLQKKPCSGCILATWQPSRQQNGAAMYCGTHRPRSWIFMQSGI